MSFLLFIILVAFVSLYIFFKQRYVFWKERGVPYPKPSLIFGNMWPYISLQKPLPDFLDDLYNNYNDSAYVGFFNFWTPAVLVRDIEIVKDVLIKQFNNFHDNMIEADYNTDPVLAKNPFLMKGEEWKIIRTQLTPQYTIAKLKFMIPMMQGVSKNLVKYINEQIDVNKCKSLEVKDISCRYTGDNVLTCAYGLNGNSFTSGKPVAFEIGEQIASPDFSVQLKQSLTFFFPALGKILKATFAGRPIPKIFWEMILNTIKHRQENNITRKDYLDFLKELRMSGTSPYEVTDAYTVAHAFTFFLDSFETSASLLMFLLYELALNPDVQSKTRAEVQCILEKYKGQLNYEAVAECEYLENVMFEALRKNPILLFLSRVCTEDYKFPHPKGTGEGVVIRKGTHVFVPVYAIHHDPQYYPNPDRFDPGRFTEEEKGSRPKCAFLGFGDGPRICMGRNYAVLQIKVVVISLLTEFELRMSSKTKVPYKRDLAQILNVPKDGIYVEFHKRF